MLATAIIAKKRDSEELSADEIRFMIRGMVDGSVPDYQISAWAMAILCRGMSAAETGVLTDCMLSSGSRLARTNDVPRVDKHSTGGLGDKVSLILAPLVACFDIHVPMLSGRGLGITGGTLDKLEAYSGYRCDLNQPEIDRQLQAIGCVVTGTTPDIAPADRKLYGLRDVTGTVPSVALITASILSKKLAASLDSLVLDVKFGSGAFMKTLADAETLAQSLYRTGKHMGLATSVVLSDMNQPLGKMVGNACEANEAVAVLSGQGPADVRELTFRLVSELLVNVGRFSDRAQATESLEQAIASGKALERYVQLIEHQGGRFQERLPLATRYVVPAAQTGWLAALDGNLLGQAVISLGGGRRVLTDRLDHSAGLEMLVKVGDAVEAGQPILHVFASTFETQQAAMGQLQQAIRISHEPVDRLPLIVETRSQGIAGSSTGTP